MANKPKRTTSVPTVKVDPPAGPRLRRVPQKLSSLRLSTLAQELQDDWDNTQGLTPIQASRPRLAPSQPYHQWLNLKDSRYALDTGPHDRTNRFNRPRGQLPAPQLEMFHGRVRLEVDNSPDSRNDSMERIREKVLADFRAGVVGCHYNYEDSDEETEFEDDEDDDEHEYDQDPIAISSHDESRANPFDSLYLGARTSTVSPLRSPLTPFPVDARSIDTHDWALQPPPSKKTQQENVILGLIPDSPDFDDDLDCECCGYDIQDAEKPQSQDSGYMSNPERSFYGQLSPPPVSSDRLLKLTAPVPRIEETLLSPKRKMSIYDMLCDPPFKRPKPAEAENDHDDAKARYEPVSEHLVAPPTSPVKGAASPSCDDRASSIQTVCAPSPDRSRDVEEWVMLNRAHTNSPELDGGCLAACRAESSFLDELEARFEVRRAMLERWDRELEEGFMREEGGGGV